ncbi:MAG TPA: hypothetical protein VHU23_11495 [Rhizomicrobium sp.]|jgi:chromosomal replication initiation ATPase DnaA|nr:hypothetical protein [Rhizomicrobium sp.]
MPLSSQLPLPLPVRCSVSRADLVVGPSNEHAVAFIDSWPGWPTRLAALHGPPGCGKSHLTAVWQQMSNATIAAAGCLGTKDLEPAGAIAIEDIDCVEASLARDTALFALFESGAPWILLSGRTPPATWACTLPDLASRFSSLTALALQSPDEALLVALARKLLSDRQLFVPDTIIDAMLRRLDRSPAAIRDFVEELDAAALASGRPVSVALVRNLVAMREGGPP